MSHQPAFGSYPGPPPPGAPPPPGGWVRPQAYLPAPPGSPSGLFPARPAMPLPPPRPTYREPHPVRVGAAFAGAGSAALWLLMFGLLGRDLAGYLWWTLLAGTIAWLVALLLIRRGDRGAGLGVAIVVAVGWAIAVGLLLTRWQSTGDWPLW